MKRFYTSVCVLALIAASGVLSPAFAQQTTAGDSASEVVVTAQRRSETLENVPITITALSPDTIEKFNVKDMMSLQVVTPGLTMTNWVGYAQTYIRGIGFNFSNPGIENPIGVFVDGAYIERGKGGNLELLDVESVQVLKGPQATLWGRNVTGGAILVNTADPEFSNSGRVTIEGGNQGRRAFEGVLNQQISDQVAVRIAARYHEEGGYYTDLLTGYEYGWSENTQIRGKVLYKPNDTFSAVLQYEHQDRLASQNANPQMLPDVLCSTCSQTGLTHPFADPFATAITFFNAGVGIDATNDFFNATLRFDLDNLSIESVTAYTDNTTDDAVDVDLTNVDALQFIIPSSNKTFTQTITATTNFGGPFESTFGVDFLDDKSTYGIRPVVPLGHINTTSISPFVEVTYKPVEALSITAGARYTRDERDARQDVSGSTAEFSDDFISPRVVIAYDFGSVNAYVSYNKGQKAGGINSPASPLGVYESETLASIEAGLKYLSDDRRLRANISAFDYDYKDLQGLAINQGGSGGPGSVQQPSAKLHGVDFDVSWVATENLEIFAGGLFLSSEYVNYDNAGVQVVTVNASGQPTGMTTGTESLTGHRLPHAADFSGFVGAKLSGPVATGWTGELSAILTYSDSYDFFAGAGGPLRFDQTPSYTMTRLSGSVKPDDGNYEVGFYVDNVTDEKNIEFRFTTAPFGATQTLSRPRSYGLRLTARF